MRIYNPNPKHELPGARGRKGSRLDLSPAEAVQLLNDPASCILTEMRTWYNHWVA